MGVERGRGGRAIEIIGIHARADPTGLVCIVHQRLVAVDKRGCTKLIIYNDVTLERFGREDLGRFQPSFLAER